MHCSLPTGRAMHFLYIEPPPTPPKGERAKANHFHSFSSGEGGLERDQELEDLKVFPPLPEKNIFQTGKKKARKEDNHIKVKL